jgi:DNA-binding transcriptional LysR family regulator
MVSYLSRLTSMQWNDVRRRIKLRDLEILVAVIQTGSMGKAAAMLNMTQPAVSKSIAHLEHTFSVRLLDRSRQGIEPTAYGHAIVKRGIAMFDELRQGAQDVAFLSDPTVGEIRVGGTEQVNSAIFAPIIEHLSRKHPRMSFHVIAGDLRMNLRELDARRIDIVVAGIMRPLDEERSVEILFNDPLVVIAGPSHPLARRRKVDVAELLEHAWTLQPADHQFASTARESFRALGLNPPKITAETTSTNLRRKLLATGRFLSMAPRSLVLFPHKDPALKILPVALPAVPRPVAIITIKGRMPNPAAQLFIDQVRTLTKRLASLK